MRYRKDYKYQLVGNETFQTSFRIPECVLAPRISLHCDGTLVVHDGYAWDGTSGPVIDRKTNQRASLGHDALYQLMRMGLLSHHLWRVADKDFATWLKEDGAWAWVIKADLLGLRIAGGRAALPKNRKKVYEAP